MTVNSKQFYSLLAQALRQAIDEAQEAGVPKPQLVVYAGLAGVDEEITIKLENAGYSGSNIECRGKDFNQVLEEYKRRHGWQRAQDSLQLAGPVVEAEAEIIQPPIGPMEKEPEDEIPF